MARSYLALLLLLCSLVLICCVLWNPLEFPTKERIFITIKNYGIYRDAVVISKEVEALFKYNITELELFNEMPQNDEDLIEYVRGRFLIPPADQSESYNLMEPEVEDQSMGQSARIRQILNNMTDGFFIECGALDGEIRSNTLYMERFLGWQGLLVEAGASNFQLVTEKKRKAWLAPTCLSTQPYPMMVSFEQKFNVGKIKKVNVDLRRQEASHVQCIPITTLLLAMNRTHVDYFSLDVEGSELEVLQTIDFDLIDIKTFSVEITHGKGGKDKLRDFMLLKGYTLQSEVHHERSFANDYIFVKN